MPIHWRVPEIVQHPDHIGKRDRGEMSWDKFHKLVSKNCGAFLAEHGEYGMREIMDSSMRLAFAKRSDPNNDIDEFMDYIDDNRR